MTDLLKYSPSGIVLPLGDFAHVASETAPVDAAWPVFHVRRHFGDISGATDAEPAIRKAIASAIAEGGGIVDFGPGIFRVDAPVQAIVTDPPIGLVLRGVPGSTVIKPSSGVGVGLEIASSGTDPHILTQMSVSGLQVDASLMGAAAIGIRVGNPAVTPTPYSSYVTMRDVKVYNATGAGARAWDIRDLIRGIFENCYGGHSETNLHIDAANSTLPTALRFYACAFRSALANGVVIEQGHGINFDDCIIEANALRGVSVVPAAGKVVERLRFRESWFEGNYASDATKYQLFADGSLVNTSISVRDCFFSSAAKAISFTAIANFVLDNVFVGNRADTIKTGVSGGTFANWAEQDSPFATVVDNDSPLLTLGPTY